MAAGCPAWQASDDFIAIEIARHMAHCPVRVEISSVPARDSRGFLTTMLQGMKAERNYSRSRVHADYPENPAFLAKFTVVERIGCKHLSQTRCRNMRGPRCFSRSYTEKKSLCRPLCQKKKLG